MSQNDLPHPDTFELNEDELDEMFSTGPFDTDVWDSEAGGFSYNPNAAPVEDTADEGSTETSPKGGEGLPVTAGLGSTSNRSSGNHSASVTLTAANPVLSNKRKASDLAETEQGDTSKKARLEETSSGQGVEPDFFKDLFDFDAASDGTVAFGAGNGSSAIPATGLPYSGDSLTQAPVTGLEGNYAGDQAQSTDFEWSPLFPQVLEQFLSNVQPAGAPVQPINAQISGLAEQSTKFEWPTSYSDKPSPYFDAAFAPVQPSNIQVSKKRKATDPAEDAALSSKQVQKKKRVNASGTSSRPARTGPLLQPSSQSHETLLPGVHGTEAQPAPWSIAFDEGEFNFEESMNFLLASGSTASNAGPNFQNSPYPPTGPVAPGYPNPAEKSGKESRVRHGRHLGISTEVPRPRNNGLQNAPPANGNRAANGPSSQIQPSRGLPAVLPTAAVANQAGYGSWGPSYVPPVIAAPAQAPARIASSASPWVANQTAVPTVPSVPAVATTVAQTSATAPRPRGRPNKQAPKAPKAPKVKAGRERGQYKKNPAHVEKWTDPVTGRMPKILKGFPRPDEPLPRGATYDYIMRHYPNHVDTTLGLEMYDRGITCNEMAEKSGGGRFNHTNYSHRWMPLMNNDRTRDWETEKQSKWTKAHKILIWETEPARLGVNHPRDYLPLPLSATHMRAGVAYQTPQQEQAALQRIQQREQEALRSAQTQPIAPSQASQPQTQSVQQTNQVSQDETQVDLNGWNFPSGLYDDPLSRGNGLEGSFGSNGLENFGGSETQHLDPHGSIPEETFNALDAPEASGAYTVDDENFLRALIEANDSFNQSSSLSGSNGEASGQGQYPPRGYGAPAPYGPASGFGGSYTWNSPDEFWNGP